MKSNCTFLAALIAVGFLSTTPVSAVADEPPYELPPITVVGWTPFRPVITICGNWAQCGTIGTEAWIDDLMEEAMSPTFPEEGGQIRQFVREVPDNPYNSEDGANCSSEGEIRANHARQDIGPSVPSLTAGTLVLIHFDNGDTEVYFYYGPFATPIAAAVPNTCRSP